MADRYGRLRFGAAAFFFLAPGPPTVTEAAVASPGAIRCPGRTRTVGLPEPFRAKPGAC